MAYDILQRSSIPDAEINFLYGDSSDIDDDEDDDDDVDDD